MSLPPSISFSIEPDDSVCQRVFRQPITKVTPSFLLKMHNPRIFIRGFAVVTAYEASSAVFWIPAPHKSAGPPLTNGKDYSDRSYSSYCCRTAKYALPTGVAYTGADCFPPRWCLLTFHPQKVLGRRKTECPRCNC